jgi:hypothetical protein
MIKCSETSIQEEKLKIKRRYLQAEQFTGCTIMSAKGA